MANVGRTLFSQVMDFVPWTSVDRLIERYRGDVRVRTLRCGEQFRSIYAASNFVIQKPASASSF